MWNVCWQCGLYRADKLIDPDGPAAICPECGHRHPFRQLPLLLVSGASGAGKSTVCQALLGQLPEVVLLDSDILTQQPLLDPTRWGLPAEAVAGLPDHVQCFWQHYQPCFRTCTRDQSEHGYDYLSALLRMEEKRNFAEIGRNVKESSENIQHFMSNSPWSAQTIFRQVQADIAATPALQHGGALIVDESADAKAGPCSAGSGRQHNGRLGKVDLCPVGVFLAFAKEHLWTWVDCMLFLLEDWFAPGQAARRQKAGIPDQGRTGLADDPTGTTERSALRVRGLR